MDITAYLKRSALASGAGFAVLWACFMMTAVLLSRIKYNIQNFLLDSARLAVCPLAAGLLLAALIRNNPLALAICAPWLSFAIFRIAPYWRLF